MARRRAPLWLVPVLVLLMVLVASQVNPDSNASELGGAIVFSVCLVALGMVFLSRMEKR